MGNAVQEMQLSSERMRDEIATLTRQSESLETTVGERTDHLAQDLDGFAQDMRGQMDRRKEHLKKMVNDVMQIGSKHCRQCLGPPRSTMVSGPSRLCISGPRRR